MLRRDEVTKLLKKKRSELFLLQERESKFAGNVPKELLIMIHDHEVEIEALQGELDELDKKQRVQEITQLILKNNNALFKLKEQLAKFGSLHVPPYILVEIEEREAEIEGLQVELKEIEANS